MVLTLVAVFAAAWCFAPQHGMLAKSRQRRAAAEPKAARSEVALAP